MDVYSNMELGLVLCRHVLTIQNHSTQPTRPLLLYLCISTTIVLILNDIYGGQKSLTRLGQPTRKFDQGSMARI